MHSWIAASMSPSHRRREKRKAVHHPSSREPKSHGAESLDPDLLCKILQSNIVKDGGKDPSRPSSLLSPSYNTLSKSCDDMSKCGSSDSGSHGEESDKMKPLETIINDKKYIGLVPAAYVSRSKSHNDIIIHRRLVTPNRSRTASPSSLPSAYMEERYVIRIKKGVNPHRLHKSSSEFLKPTNELCRSFSAQNLNAENPSHGGGSHGSGSGSGSGGSHNRHEIITTFGCAPNSAPSSREVSPESVTQKDSANGNYHHHQQQQQQQQHHSHHSHHSPHSPHHSHHSHSHHSHSHHPHQHHQHHHHHHQHQHQPEIHHQSERMSEMSPPASPLHHHHNNNNNNNNNHKTSHTVGNIAKAAEEKEKLHLDLPRPGRRHSFVGGQTSYAVSIKSPIRSTDTHSLLSVDGLKKLLSPGGKKTHHKESK